MPRVLQLISSSGYFGADNVLVELSRELLKASISSTVGVFVNRQNPHLEVAQEANKHHLPVEIFRCGGRLDLRTFSAIRRFVERQRLDIVHTHGYKANFYALAATHGTGVRTVATCHNWIVNNSKLKLYAQLDKLLLHRFDRVIAVSETVREKILAERFPPEYVQVIDNGIDMHRFRNSEDRFRIRTELGIREGTVVVGTAGRLSPEKGHAVLLDAAQIVIEKHPGIVFMIVGDGPLRGALESRCSASGVVSDDKHAGKLPCVFTGFRSDMVSIYSAMDIFVLPSLNEGLPMALLEAAASGLPLVATRVGAIPSVIEDGHSGYLVEPGEANTLAKAIVSLLADPGKARSQAERARHKVSLDFSSGKMAERYIEIYRDVLGTSRA